jgi:hypothetical protein
VNAMAQERSAFDRFELLTPLVEWVEKGTAHDKSAGDPEALASDGCRS